MDIPTVVRRDGTKAIFEPSILERSLIRAGGDVSTARIVVSEVLSHINNGETTDHIYKKAFNLLEEYDKRVAMRYSLKRALFNMGPSGFPFEEYVGELFRLKNYEVSVGVHLLGHCVAHEVDVLAKKEDETIAMELKFHNDIAGRTDVKIALYVKSRMDDLLTSHNGVTRGMLITNTKFTTQAIQYAQCAGLEMVGWGYPAENNLRTLIESVGAHPVTCLPSLKKSEASICFNEHITTCSQFIEKEDFLRMQGIKNMDVLISEAKTLCAV
ncbi:MAG: restriction endonuclease [Alphaproteobacteria bacterium]|nr:restriction endonuclease [Alphaproteobacteria bacterium]